jgi:muramoyltetrapeptide carboxypeptidase
MNDAAFTQYRGHYEKPIKPRRLGPGSVIGIAAPAGSFERKDLEKGVFALRSMGFEVVVPDDIFLAERYFAGNDAQRCESIHRLFADPGIDAVMCARGGYGSLRILPLVDFTLIGDHPKVIIGFSDITALLSAISMRCGLAVFHGPVLTTLGEASERTVAGLLEAVACDRPLKIRSQSARAWRPGIASGTLGGGNLTTLCHLLGTPFAPCFREHIVFLEDRGEAPYRIDRMLTHLKTAGCFEGVEGLVLGSFQDCGDPAELKKIVEDVFEKTEFPILSGMEAGHTDPNRTRPLGIRMELDTERQSLTFECPTEA